MQIDIDFELFKELTALRENERDSYSNVIRRLMDLPPRTIRLSEVGKADVRFGVWFGNVHFPEGTKFRATYKGATFIAEIRGDRWVDQHGVERNSPSEAAGAISGTNVNGWRFWYALRPGEDAWHRLDELKP